MKSLLTLILITVAAVSCFGQSKHHYWRVEYTYQTECKSGYGYFSCDTRANNLDYNSIAISIKKWAYPNKIAFQITSFRKLAKPDTDKGNKFSCVPDPAEAIYFLNDSTAVIKRK